MKKIDIHTHICAFPQYAPPKKGDKSTFVSVEDQLRMHDEINVDIGVILPIVSKECQWMNMTSEEAKFIADQYPDRFVWFCNVDPRQGEFNENADLEYIVGHYKSLGAKGLGELTTPLPADHPMMDNLFGACERLDMPVLVHIAPKYGDYYGIIDELGLPRIEKMLKKHPDLKLIGHSQCFWTEISGDNTNETRNKYPTGKVKEGGRIITLMREYGNLYCDISASSGLNALTRDPEFAAKFIEEFSDRILFGADICAPTNTHHFGFDKFFDKMLADGMISRENYEKIMRKNSEKLLGLDKK